MTENSLLEQLDALKKEMESIKRLNKELMDIQQKQDSLDFAWSGNLGHWYWDFPENRVRFNPMKATALGFEKAELPEYVDFQFFTNRLHPDDYDRVMDAMRNHLSGSIPVWEVKYRIMAKDGSYRTYYDRGKVTQRASDGSPLFLSGIVFDISNYESEREQLLQENKEWEQLNRQDSLTGLYNRSNILFKLGQIINEVNSKTINTVSMIVLDIDNLKHQNALFGPLFGDELIKQAAVVINSVVGDLGFAGAFEGGKFIIVLPDLNKSQAFELAEKVRASFNGREFTEPADVTSSSGVAEFRPNETVSEFFNRAEQLLYKVKQNGKNKALTD